MAWRFKASKYKNAAPIVPKPEACVRDVVVGSYQTYGNNISASAAFMAFNWEHTGSSLAVLPIDDCGRKSKSMPLLHAHSDTVTDIEFSPFHDGLLATASQDCLVKIWHIPEKGLENSLSEPECTFSHKQRRVETVGFHPTADFLLYSTSSGNINLWDITTQKEIFSNNEHPEVIQSLCWKQDGTLMATSCKDKIVRILDPRKSSAIQMSADSHQSIKDSRIVWLGDQNRILTTGFDSGRLRQVIIRDLRNFNTPEKTIELDCSTGILMPLFDPDTNMLFLAGKGDTTISYMEVTDKDPYLIEGLRHTGEQTKGACLVPKRALKVMEGEVNRILQLTSNSVIPIMYQVPRKTYRDFHSDLYPDTNGFKTELTASQWFNGINIPVPKISLDPAKRDRGDSPMMVHRGNLKELIKNLANKQTLKQQSHNGKVSSVVVVDRVIKKENNNKVSDSIMMDNNLMKQQNKIDIIKKFDNKYKMESEKDLMMMMNLTQKNNQKQTKIESKNIQNDFQNDDSDNDTVTSTDNIKDSMQLPPLSISTFDNNSIEDGGTRTEITTPPKPLPRTSRNNSISEQHQQQQQQQQNNEDNILPRPIARPRMTTTSYKPRLGPKPFTSNSVDVSFDKVFSVPQAPGVQQENETDISVHVQLEKQQQQQQQKPEIVEIHIKKQSEIKNGEKRNTEKDDCDDDGPKSLTTSERRKSADESELFESNNSESSGNSTEGEDKPDSELKRLSANRSSIAERRRMYENRSKSVQEEKPQSPIPLIRRDSLKNQGDIIKQSTPSPADNKRCSINDNKTPEIKDEKRKNSDILRKSAEPVVTSTKRTSTVFGKVSKFRHLKGTPAHKSTHIENLRNLSRQIPGECNGFHANYERVAVPLSGPGGKIAIFELNKPGRLPDGVIPSLVNGCNIMDFQWDPFDVTRLAVACDDGIVKFWQVPNGGLTEPTNTPESELIAHLDKIYFIRFHPLAKDVFLTASYDMTIKIWNLKTMKEKINLKGHTEQIFDFAWSPCGVFGATVSKDGKIRVYNPRKSENPIREGIGPAGSRGARITWAIEGQYLLVTGFDKVSERQISIYNSHNLSAPLNTVSLDVSPAILIPYYDEDSSVLFTTGKGDLTIYAYEITDEEPHIVPLSHHRCSSLHQGLSFLSKNHCDVANVEFAKALRLTNNAIEPLSFTVPRIKSELFQDDLFPPTRVTWIATITAEDWFSLNDKRPKKISLKPEGMECLSSIQQPSSGSSVVIGGGGGGSSGGKKLDSININTHGVHRLEDAKAKQMEIQKSLSARLEYTNAPLEQDSMEGVDEAEWED